MRCRDHRSPCSWRQHRAVQAGLPLTHDASSAAFGPKRPPPKARYTRCKDSGHGRHSTVGFNLVLTDETLPSARSSGTTQRGPGTSQPWMTLTPSWSWVSGSIDGTVPLTLLLRRQPLPVCLRVLALGLTGVAKGRQGLPHRPVALLPHGAVHHVDEAGDGPV